MADSSVTVVIEVDLSGWYAAVGRAGTGFSRTLTEFGVAAEQARANVEALQRSMTRWQTFDETARWGRRQRRYRTHVFERPSRARMHSAYRARTRRRNRRG